jgi:hypothetical protein
MGTELPNQKPKEIRYCRACGKVLKYWRSPFCSDECAASGATQPKAEPKQSNPPASIEPTDAQPKVADTRPNGRVSKRGVLNDGAPTKATDELLGAILDDLALGLTEQEACAGNGIAAETFCRWKSLPEFEELRAKAKYHQIKRLLHKQETEPMDWKRWQWRLQVTARDQFGDPTKVGVQINAQFNNGNLGGISQEELADTRKRLDEVDLRRAHWRVGTASDVELRECMIEERDQAQHVIDLIDEGASPDQSTQQDLYQRFHEKGHDRQSPIKEAIGHVTDSNDYHQLAIEDAPLEPGRAIQGTSMRASDMDPSSGQPTAPPEPEPHIRQRDRRTLTGPLSERQQQLAQQRRSGRDDGSGKRPW